jgi:uncharacterized membrane protein YhhN
MTALPVRRAQPLPHYLFVAGAALALSHTLSPYFDLGPVGQPAWKASGIALLGVYALLSRARLAGVALLLSAVGDVALDLTPPQMVAGMAAFGLAHVFYLAAFATRTDLSRPSATRIALIVAVLAVSAGLLVWLLDGMEAQQALLRPGLAYQGIITTMVALAMASRAPLITRIGAVLFMASDTLIAFELYKNIQVPEGSVWISYAIAQILMARGFATASR